MPGHAAQGGFLQHSGTCQPGDREGTTVGPTGMRVEGLDVRGPVGDQPVQQLERRQAAGEGRIEPAPADHPRTSVLARVLDDSPLDLALILDAVQVELAQRTRRHEKVDMRVVERGQDPRATGVDYAIRGHAAVPTPVMRSPSTTTAFESGRCHTLPLTIARDATAERQCSGMAKLETDVARASTLPSTVYLDPAVLAREKDRIFARTWQLVAHRNELARPGDFKPTTILDEPILLTHAQDGKLHGFYNVCRHRAALVVSTRGNRKSLQCGYHGWVYGLDGKLQTAREMEGTEDFDKADFGLVPIRVDTL